MTLTTEDLCREFGISRKTGYKWAQRFLDGGVPNLVDRLRVPHVLPHAVASEAVDAIVAPIVRVRAA